MINIQARIEVIVLDKKSLRTLMRFRGFTVRSLAEKAGCAKSTIAYLTNPEDRTRWTTSTETAKKIAKALDFPVESLFEVKVSRVSRESRKIAA